MGVPRRAQLAIGTPVSIILKKDQRTGRQVQGVVAEILTRGDHHRGVKVRLSDGSVGRVQALVGVTSSNSSAVMANGNDHQLHTPPSSGRVRDVRYDEDSYDSSRASVRATISDYLPFADERPPPRPTHPPARPSRPEDRTEQSPPYHLHMFDRPALPAEVQAHGARALSSSDAIGGSTADRDQELLRQEFPKIDGALIAAVYHDHQSLSACREILEQIDS